MLSPQQREELIDELCTKFVKFSDEDKTGLPTLSKEDVEKAVDFWFLVIDSILTEKQERMRKLPVIDRMDGTGVETISKIRAINILKE